MGDLLEFGVRLISLMIMYQSMDLSALIFQNYFNKSGNGSNKLVKLLTNDFLLRRSKSPFYTIVFIKEGSLRCDFIHKRQVIGANEFLLINKGESYEFLIKSKKETKGISIDILEPTLIDVFKNLHFSDEFLFDNDSDDSQLSIELIQSVFSSKNNVLGKQLKTIAQQVLSDDKLPSLSSALFYNVCCQLLFFHKQVIKSIGALSLKKVSSKRELFERLNKAVRLVEASPGKDWDIQNLAQEVALSEFHFYRTFKTVYSITPYQFILNNKLEYAISLLQEQKCSISEIAYLAGFSDIFSFSNTFKRNFGISPSQFFNKKSIVKAQIIRKCKHQSLYMPVAI